jgi:hypothetical protein
MNQIYTAGTLLRFETTIETSLPPFESGYILYSPPDVRLTIQDPGGVDVILDAPMQEVTVGKFYADIQSLPSWNKAGAFKATVTEGSNVLEVKRFRLTT